MPAQNFITRPGSQFIPAGTGAVERTVESKLQDAVSVLDFIPESEHAEIKAGTSTYDATTAIQAAINTGSLAVVPEGTYNVSDTILISSNKHLHLEANAVISKATGTTEPVVRLYGSYASLTGSGFSSRITTTDVSGGNPTQPWTEGIVHVGMLNGTSQVNTNWCLIEKLRISGNSTRWSAYNSSAGVDNDIESDIGIKMANPDVFLAGSNSLYFTTVRDIHFSYVGKCFELEPVVQGNFFYNIHAYRCTTYGFNIYGSNENSIIGTFFHSCPGITYLKLQKSLSAAEAAAAGYSYYAYTDRGCREHLVSHLMGEPGTDGPQGRDSRVFELADTSVSNNYLHIQTNTGHSSLNNANPLANTIYNENTFSLERVSTKRLLASEEVSSDSGGSEFGTLAMTTPDDYLAAYGHRFCRIGVYSFSAGDKKDICTFNLPSTSTAARITITALHGWTSASTSSWGTDELSFQVFRGNSSSANIVTFSSLKRTTTGFCELLVSGTTVTVSYYSQHNTNVRFYCVINSARLNADADGGVQITALDGTTDSTQPVLPGASVSFGRPVLPITDNVDSLGSATNRWSEVFAGTGTINTSDANLKQQISDLSDQEKSTALAIKNLVKKFKYNDAVSRKGDDARIHVGVVAQEVEQAFIDNGLDPEAYGLFCKDTWWELDGSPIDVEEGEQPPTGAVLQSRLGIRYNELLAFVVSAV